MANYSAIERRLQEVLELKHRPVTVTFLDAAPAGLEKLGGTQPSGCSFWRLAMAGRSFYTVPADHLNCPVGAYTHNIAAPADRANELTDILGVMTGLGYLKMEEVPGIPVLKDEPNVIAYGPLGDARTTPDVVLIAATPSKIMLLEEAAIRAGVGSKLPLLARPTCMAIPAAIGGAMVTSAGCIGNRVYTDLGGDELYSALAGSTLEAVADALETVVSANAALADYHKGRRAQLATS
jgi:uncharacterized protein (DUF169 family)